jgi:peroxiredoxin
MCRQREFRPARLNSPEIVADTPVAVPKDRDAHPASPRSTSPMDSEAVFHMTVSTLLLVMLFAAGSDPTASSHSNADPQPSPAPTLASRAQEPPITPVMLGDVAPDFSYQSFDGHWRKLRGLLSQGPVLLVFGATPDQLRALQSERDALLDRGVTPVAVLDEKPGRTWALVRDLGLTYTVLSDPRRVVAGQFNALRSNAEGSAPAWFVIDRKGVVRNLGRGRLPAASFSSVAARALDLQAPGEALPASR